MKNPPHTYIRKLRGYLDPKVTRKVSIIHKIVYTMSVSHLVACEHDLQQLKWLYYYK